MEFPAARPVRLRISLPVGQIRIVAAERDTATVELAPAGRGGNAAEQLIERTRIEAFDDVVVVEVPSGSWFLRGAPALTVTVAVPSGSSAELRVGSADVEATGLLGDVRLLSGSGAARFGRIGGSLDVRGASGNVVAIEVGGKADVKTASGNVVLESVGGDANVRTASGSVRLGTAGGNVVAKTASGSVTVDAAAGRTVAAFTASGDVSVGVPAGVTAWLDAVSASGKVSSDLELDAAPPAGEAQVSVRVRSASGRVRIHRAHAAPVG